MKSHNVQLITEAEVYKADGSLKGTYKIDAEDNRTARFVATVKDKFGKVIQTVSGPFRSFNPSFAKTLNYAFLEVQNDAGGAAGDQITLVATGNPTTDTHNMKLVTASGNSMGIVVGTGSANPSFSDTTLGTIIADGSSATQLSHGATTVTPMPATSGKYDYNEILISRVLTNNSGGDITLQEVGLYALGTTAAEYIMIARDNQTLDAVGGSLTDLALTIADGQVCEVRYYLTLETDATYGGFTSNFLGYLASEFKDASVTVKEYDGTETAVDFTGAQTDKALLNTTDGNDDYGILIGSSSAPFSITNYTLTGRIEDSSMDYGAMTTIDLETTTEGSDVREHYMTFGAQRDFTSQETTETVFVREAAIVIRKGISPYDYYLIGRVRYINDVSSTDGVPTGTGTGISIEPGELLRIKIYFKTILFEQTGI